MSINACSTIKGLLNSDPHKRLTAISLRKIPFFDTINWDEIRQNSPPFVPKTADLEDTSYFDGKFTIFHCKYIHLINRP